MKATLYFGTGFDSVNVPASKQVLMQAAQEIREFDALDIIDPYFQTSIRVKAKAGILEGYDYLSLDDSVYYSIMSVVPLSVDTANITVVMDTYLTYYSADHGTAQLAFIGGSVVRSTAPFNMLFNLDEYNGSDPYFQYSECVERSLTLFDPRSSQPGLPFENTIIYGSSYSDDIDESYVDQDLNPDIKYNNIASKSTKKSLVQIGTRAYAYPGLTLYQGTSILNVAKILYGLNIDNVIDKAYIIPAAYLGDIEKSGGAITSIKGVLTTQNSLINPNPTGALSLREDIGTLIFKSFGIITLIAVGSGNKSTYSGSDILLLNGNRSFNVNIVSDPSPEGAPYFKPELINDPFDSSAIDRDPLGYMYGGVKGATWQNAPVSFGSKGYQADLMRLSNNLIAYDKQTFATDAHMNSNFNIKQESILLNRGFGIANDSLNDYVSDSLTSSLNKHISSRGNVTRTINKTVNTNSHDLVGSFGSMALGVLDSGVSAINAFRQYRADSRYYQSIRDAERAREIEQFNIDHIVRTTDLKFPVTDTSQNITGNGCAIITELPSLTDRNRFLQIVQQFGVAVPGYKKISDALLDRVGNEPFVYIQAKGVSFSSIVPKRVKNDLSSMFESGVRIWYEKPSQDAYTRMYKKEA